MSSDFRSKLLRTSGAIVLIALSALATGCQVRPLYSEAGGVAQKLGSIAYSEAGSRIGQVVRNKLIFLTAGGNGEPANPEYKVDLTVTSSVAQVLLVETSDRARAGQVAVAVDYILRRNADGQVLKAGHRQAISLVDFPVQEFAKVRAIRDAENRAANEAAELVRADLAAALGR
ncbi:LPS assembly lipoprotein LptE [Rhizobium sp. YJ-22]|uniref:LPS assembly lipoprotein LptE n=1 Tax=Rhizobium sp. YJ-22 TaxID=3037556 RepID=UPI002412805B|nr:LPS assembly lipoprotein LptE [Rhizobium sp. YJ-22]MDG3577623.1 LPS assembly lipoprotein LptE [Rhizobium sp. YJ-22]